MVGAGSSARFGKSQVERRRQGEAPPGPGLATSPSPARIAYHGVGESLAVDDLSVDALHALMQRVLNTHSYREKAHYFKNIIAQRRGLDLAAETIERALEAALANCALELSRS